MMRDSVTHGWLGDRIPVAWKRRARRLFHAAGLLPVFAVVYYLAHWLRFEGTLGPREWEVIGATVASVLLVKLVVFTWFRVYQGWNHYVTFHDLTVLGEAATASAVLIALGDYLFHPQLVIPRSVFLMDWCGTILVVGALQALSRLVRERGRFAFWSVGKTPVFIVGANDSGEALLRAILRNRNLPYHVVGFTAEDIGSLGARIGGVPVVGTLEQTCSLAKTHGVSEVLITAGELSGKQVRKLVEEGRSQNVHVKMLPSYEQLLGGTVAMRPRDVSIEDLLHRDPVRLDGARLHQWIDGRVLLVTGSAGSIGSELCRQLLQFEPERLVLVDRSENGQFFLERELRRLAPDRQIDICLADISDVKRMEQIFETYRPNIIFHAAAYKHVPMMEANAGEAVKNIVLSTQGLADLADRHGVESFVMISTDKAVNPTSVMGACKRVAELYVQSLVDASECRFVTVRFGNVLDSAGSVVPVFREQIARGGPVTVTHPDMERFFMTIPEASQLVIQAGVMGRGGEIFVLDMGVPVRIVDLAKDMIRLSGLTVNEDIEIDFVGPRPGEKLREELHGDGEKRVATRHPKIVVAQCEVREFQSLLDAVHRLQSVSEQSTEAIVAQLREIVPEFQEELAVVPVHKRLAA